MLSGGPSRVWVTLLLVAAWVAPTPAPLVLHIADYATMPITGSPDGTGNDAYLARVNFMREEPGGRRFFVNDLNGPLYILDKRTRALTTYLDFNGAGERRGLFHRLAFENGLAGGFITFQFDPDYKKNGKFYTIHLDDPEVQAPFAPDRASVPGLDTTGYTTSATIVTPGEIEKDAVLVEWTDTNIANSTFEGTARELMRVQLNSRIHPMGDLIFNPTARPGDPDWRVLYIACGDGGSGEQRSEIRLHPQRLDTLVGKILRIVPDLTSHTDSSTLSENGRYRIPRDNPFTSIPGARKEIWAYGLRNPHRLTWDVDPASPRNNHLIAAVIGLNTWETVDIIHRGANYGYSMREGTQAIRPDNRMEALPEPDTIPVHVTDTIENGTIVPTYPVIEYPHKPGGGDAIAGGFVYRGRAVPALRGKFLFADITTGRIWYADYKEMLAADDGNPQTLAEKHEVQIVWANESDGHGKSTYPTMAPIVESAYHARGGKDPDLPGRASMAGTGRVDVRFAVDSAGELYILSKSDGMIRAVVGAEHLARQ